MVNRKKEEKLKRFATQKKRIIKEEKKILKSVEKDIKPSSINLSKFTYENKKKQSKYLKIRNKLIFKS